ncbi:MAG: GTP-binding protein [Candidatus Thermoplasmatota archaeon]|nr:GTP-binding protein [Candidatus Thermoplasmatota archaeon]
MDSADLEKQIKDIEDEIFNTQKNKATEHHIGKLKAKIAKLKEQIEKRQGSGGKGKGFAVKKTGDATIGLVGYPSIGKSTLLNRLTEANSEVGTYEFTTLDVIPGMLKYDGANIQILDLPGIISGAAKGRGRGKEVLAAARNVDLIVFMLDAKKAIEQLTRMNQELHHAGMRINEKKPRVIITSAKQGGITIHTPIKQTHITKKTMYSIASEYVTNADIIIRENITEDRFIDSFMNNRIYLPAISLINKADIYTKKQIKEAEQSLKKHNWVVYTISAKKHKGIKQLKKGIYHHLHLIKIYMKPQGKKPDYSEPLILKKGATVETVCKQIHRDFKEKFRYAQVWGTSGKYPGQKVGLDHKLDDEDLLTVVITH